METPEDRAIGQGKIWTEGEAHDLQPIDGDRVAGVDGVHKGGIDTVQVDDPLAGLDYQLTFALQELVGPQHPHDAYALHTTGSSTKHGSRSSIDDDRVGVGGRVNEALGERRFRVSTEGSKLCEILVA